jgi:MOSC domain-containing protein
MTPLPACERPGRATRAGGGAVRVGTVERIWRYPVKSMLGEPLATAELGRSGLAGDRQYAVRDAAGKLGSGKSSARFRRFPGLLAMSARYTPDGTAVITLPDGRTVRTNEQRVHDELRAALGCPELELAAAAKDPFVDDAPVHLVTAAALGWLAAGVPQTTVDERRLRPNLLIRTAQGTGPTEARPPENAPVGAGWPIEDGWVGGTLRIGATVRLRVTKRTQRCVMVNAAQQDLPHSAEVLRSIAARNGLTLGVHAEVLAGGPILLGDPVTLE